MTKKKVTALTFILCLLFPLVAFAENIPNPSGVTVDTFISWVTENSDQSCTHATASVDTRTLFSMSTDQQNVIQGFTFENSDIIEYVQATMKDENASYIKSYLTAFSEKETLDEKYADARAIIDAKTADLFSALSFFWSKSTLLESYYLELGMEMSPQAVYIIWLNASSGIEKKDVALSMFKNEYPISATGENTRVTAPVVQDLTITSVRLRDYYNTKVFSLKLKNTSKTDTIDAFSVVFKCYDPFGDSLSSFSEEADWWRTLTLKPRKSFSMGSYFWYLFDYQTCSRIDVAVSKYHIKNGSTVTIPESEYVWVSGELK